VVGQNSPTSPLFLFTHWVSPLLLYDYQHNQPLIPAFSIDQRLVILI
jgi:hypothetical protein